MSCITSQKPITILYSPNEWERILPRFNLNSYRRKNKYSSASPPWSNRQAHTRSSRQSVCTARSRREPIPAVMRRNEHEKLRHTWIQILVGFSNFTISRMSSFLFTDESIISSKLQHYIFMKESLDEQNNSFWESVNRFSRAFWSSRAILWSIRLESNFRRNGTIWISKEIIKKPKAEKLIESMTRIVNRNLRWKSWERQVTTR
jgi:hypothetical protein